MTVTMAQIDEERDLAGRILDAQRGAPTAAARRCLTRHLDAQRAVVEALLREWWAQGCREVADSDLLSRAYAEIRRQVFGSRVVFDREIVEIAESFNPDNQRTP